MNYFIAKGFTGRGWGGFNDLIDYPHPFVPSHANCITINQDYQGRGNLLDGLFHPGFHPGLFSFHSFGILMTADC
jgi:hypothetical protein